MNTHKLHLAETPFKLIKSGQKTIESRLYDNKRRLIKIGDRLVFINRKNPSETIQVEVTNLIKYATFQ